MAMLELINLCKSYRDFSLGPIDLSLKPGAVYGLIGANGAGKSTLFRCLMGTIRRNQGIVKINGQTVTDDSGSWKDNVGYVGDYLPLFEHWSGARNLQEFSAYYDKYSEETVQSLASRLDLNLDLKAGAYSTGQRSKLAIIHALAHDAAFLLLDEPTAGLDPVARDTFMELLYEQLKREDRTILYATHYISEIEQIADEFIFIDQGKVLGHKLRADLDQFWRKITFRFERDFGDLPNQVSIKSEGAYHEVISNNHESTILFLEQAGAETIQTNRLSMEQICVQIIKGRLGK